MTQQIDVPGMGLVEFPDDMNDDQISTAIKRNLSMQKVQKPDAQPEPKGGIGQSLFDTYVAGPIKGVSRIGDTILSVRDAAENGIARMMGANPREDNRAKQIDEFMRDRGVDTESMGYAAGDLSAQIAGTAGVGRVLGGLSKAAGLTRLGTALETGGMTTGATVKGFVPKAGDVALRLTGGAATGAASTGLIDPNDADTGAVIGAALPLPLQYAGKGIQRLFGGATNNAGRALNKVAGDDQAAIIAALNNNVNPMPGISANAGEAAMGVGNTVFAATQKIADASGGSKAALAKKLADESAQLKVLMDIAKTPAEYQAAKDELYRVTGAMREEAFKQADMAGRIAPKLAGDVEAFEGIAANKVQDVRDFSRMGQSAQGLADSGQMRLGGPTQPGQGLPRISGRYSYGSELAQRAEGEAANAAGDSLTYGNAARFKQMQLDSMKQSGLNPLDTRPISSRVDEMLNADGDRIVTLNQQVLGQFGEKLDEAARLGGGQTSVRDLYALRKSEINAIVESLSKSPDDGIKKRAAGLVASLKTQIDDAIEASGATGWGKYIKEFEAGAGRLDEMKLAKELAFKMSTALEGARPAAYTNAMRKAETDISRYTGKPEADSFSFANRDKLNTLESQLLRDAQFKEQASAGTQQARTILGNQFETKLIPNPLNPTITWANKLLDLLQHKSGEKTMNELARLMQNPQETAKAMSMVAPNERRRIEQLMAVRFPAYAAIPNDNP